tara:strand:+ start:1065 stop:1481 length:417 start_codon:yes stop_codon:yes gene_type:complete
MKVLYMVKKGGSKQKGGMAPVNGDAADRAGYSLLKGPNSWAGGEKNVFVTGRRDNANTPAITTYYSKDDARLPDPGLDSVATLPVVQESEGEAYLKTSTKPKNLIKGGGKKYPLRKTRKRSKGKKPKATQKKGKKGKN